MLLLWDSEETFEVDTETKCVENSTVIKAILSMKSVWIFQGKICSIYQDSHPESPSLPPFLPPFFPPSFPASFLPPCLFVDRHFGVFVRRGGFICPRQEGLSNIGFAYRHTPAMTDNANQSLLSGHNLNFKVHRLVRAGTGDESFAKTNLGHKWIKCGFSLKKKFKRIIGNALPLSF